MVLSPVSNRFWVSALDLIGLFVVGLQRYWVLATGFSLSEHSRDL